MNFCVCCLIQNIAIFFCLDLCVKKSLYTLLSSEPQKEIYIHQFHFELMMTEYQDGDVFLFSFDNFQAQNVQVCDIPEEVVERLKKFRFRKEKNVAAIMCQ